MTKKVKTDKKKKKIDPKNFKNFVLFFSKNIEN